MSLSGWGVYIHCAVCTYAKHVAYRLPSTTNKLYILYFNFMIKLLSDIYKITWTFQVHTIDYDASVIRSPTKQYTWAKIEPTILSLEKNVKYEVCNYTKCIPLSAHVLWCLCPTEQQRTKTGHVSCCLQQLGIVSIIWGKGHKKGSLTIICDIFESPWWRYLEPILEQSNADVYHLKSLQCKFSEDIGSATQALKTLWLSSTHRPSGRWATNQLLLRSVTDHLWMEGDLLHTKHPFPVSHEIHLYLHCCAL